MKKSEIRQIIKKEVIKLNEYRYADAQRPKNLVKKKDYTSVISKELLSILSDLGKIKGAKVYKTSPSKDGSSLFIFDTKWAKSKKRNIKEDLIKEISVNGGVWLSSDTFANKKLVEAGQIHLKGYMAELMPNGKTLWLMPNKGARDWDKEVKYLKSWFGKIKTIPHEMDSLEITLPEKSDKVELELILTGKLER